MTSLKPSDAEIASAIDEVRGDVQNLKLAAYVLDEYVRGELKSSRVEGKPRGFDYLLTNSQVEGFIYMLDKVRGMAASLERAIDEAFDPSEREGKI